MFDLFDLQLDATCIHCDNQSCVKLSENPVFHDKSNHIEISVKLLYVAMEEQIGASLISRYDLTCHGTLDSLTSQIISRYQ